MVRNNMGRLDRTARLIAGAALFPIGAILLGGWHGDSIGVLVSVFALVNIVTSLTGFCPGYIPLGVSTLAGGREGADTAVRPATLGAPPVGEVRFGPARAGAAGLPLA